MSWADIGSFISKGVDLAKKAAPLISTAGAIYSEYRGTKKVAEMTEEGAREQAEVERLKRGYAQKIFEEDIERQRPFYEAGVKAGVKYPEAITNRLDPTQSGAYKLQREMIEKDLATAPEYVRRDSLQRLEAIEAEKQKERLLDLQKIGLGAAGVAGTGGMSLTNVLSQSYGIQGQATASAMQTAAEQRQSAWNVAASQIMGLPAYLASRQPIPQPGPGVLGTTSGITPAVTPSLGMQRMAPAMPITGVY